VLTSIYASQILELGIPFSTGGEPGPAFLPVALCLFMYLAGLRILHAQLTEVEPVIDEEPKSDTVPRLAQVGPQVVLVLTMLYLLAFPWIGYFFSTVFYTLLIALFFNYEFSGNWKDAAWKSALTAVAITAFGWLFFVQLFGLFLPVWGG
ncbi:MAG: tripartite tricarboxylate transporter TctB family protein, partial [Rhodobacterales bacterium]